MDSTSDVIKLLIEIKEELKGDSIIVAVIASGAAIIGMIVSGLFQHITAKFNAKNERERQRTGIKSELIAKQRQEWMDSIRNTSAELLADISLLYNENIFGNLSNKEKQDIFTRIVKNTSYVELKMNLKKDKQEKVVTAIDAIKNELNKCIESDVDNRSSIFISHVTDFKNALRDVFEETWHQIKIDI